MLFNLFLEYIKRNIYSTYISGKDYSCPNYILVIDVLEFTNAI